MKTLAALILLVLSSWPVLADEKKESQLFRGLGYGMYGAQIGDVVSTEVCLARGCREQNPLWKNDEVRRFVGYPLKLGYAYGVNRFTAKLYQKHPLAAILVRAGVVVGTSIVVTHNFQLSMTVRF